MGYILEKDSFNEVLNDLSTSYRLYAPVRKIGEGRFTDVDVVRYDFVSTLDEIELEAKSEFSFKELLTPLSQTLFYFTEDETKEASLDTRDTIIFLRSCDLHAVGRLDDIYLNNKFEDSFYAKVRKHIKFALIGCAHSYDHCFCVSMNTNKSDNYIFSIDIINDYIHSDVKEEAFVSIFDNYSNTKQDVVPQFVTENDIKVTIPETIPNSIYKSDIWDEYSSRCINCGRCTMVCPTCTCFNMQDIFYTDNGNVGERRRVAGSCMMNGYSDVAGGGSYRKSNGERMRFKVLHKIYNHRRRFNEDMCVGCGRCDDVCPEYISFSNIINKVNQYVEEENNNESK